jgi:hypothetical protein
MPKKIWLELGVATNMDKSFSNCRNKRSGGNGTNVLYARSNLDYDAGFEKKRQCLELHRDDRTAAELSS